MDHLIQASNTILEEWEVPYYGNPSFEKFWMANPIKVDIESGSGPQSVKVVVHHQDGSVMTLMGLHGLTAFFQAWTFFGLLRTFFELQPLSVDVKGYFLVQKESGCFVTTRSLLRCLAICRFDHECSGTASDFTCVVKHHMMTEKLRNFYHEAIQDSIDIRKIYFGEEESSLKDMEKVHLATILLTETLLRHVSNTQAPLDEKTHLMRSFRRELLPVIKERFLASGWCPSDFGNLNQYDSPSLLLSLSSINHCEERKKYHEHCSSDKCRYTIQESCYVSSHTSICTGCAQISVNNELISSIWERRSIPIIKVVQGADVGLSIAEFDLDQVQNSIVAAPPRGHQFPKACESNISPYIAISHVWSQGLGNPAQNALPSCQLLHLQSLVNESNDFQPLHFWIDTICVPVQGRSRKTAIQNMRHVYQNASMVLVIDKTLTDFNPLMANTGEVLLRIYGSPWNRRLWTYQEGILAKNLAFQFKCGSINLSTATELDEEALAKRPELQNLSFLRVPQGGSRGLLWLILDPAISRIAREFNAYKQIPCGWKEGKVISELAMHLATRRTTNAKDEPICIATALGLDVRGVLALPGDERMQYIFRQFEQVPSNILFSMRSHHDAVGSRWIPNSLLWDPHSSPIQSRDFGQVTDSGLVVRFPGWLFKGDQNILSCNMQNMQPFPLCHDGQTYTAEIQTQVQVLLDTWAPQAYGVIYPSGQVPDLMRPDRNNIYIGLLVKFLSSDGAIISCLRAGVVCVRVWAKEAPSTQDAMVEFSVAFQNQKWCVR